MGSLLFLKGGMHTQLVWHSATAWQPVAGMLALLVCQWYRPDNTPGLPALAQST